MKATELLYIDEFPQVVELGRAMQQECEPDILYDDLVAMSNLYRCVQDMERKDFNIWIVKDGDEIIGFSIASISPYLYSKATLASMHVWYVVPKHRGSRAAFELLHNYERWATLNGARRIEVGVAKCNADEAESLNRIFKKRKFAKYGELFYRET